MKGPARLTAWAKAFSVRNLTSQLRCTSAKASGAERGQSTILDSLPGKRPNTGSRTALAIPQSVELNEFVKIF